MIIDNRKTWQFRSHAAVGRVHRAWGLTTIHVAMAALLTHGTMLWADPPAAGGNEDFQPVELRDRVPYGQSPINYDDPANENPVARLAARLQAGTAELVHRAEFNYVPALLAELQIADESQLLVFSKTALNPKLVTPRNPRAVYFNDSTSVGWVPGAAALEIVTWDRSRGPVFYTLKVDSNVTPRFQREERCLACHAGSSAWNVPGWLRRSFVTAATGKPVSGYSQSHPATPYENRWGGWFVTGRHSFVHLGNVYGEDRVEIIRSIPEQFSKLEQLPEFESSYPVHSSDVVTHLVLDHQVAALNLIGRVFYEERLNRRSDALEQLADHLALREEPGFPQPVPSASSYARWFRRRQPAASNGHSLFELDLETRLLKHDCSWLVYSEPFASLSADAHTRLADLMFAGTRAGVDGRLDFDRRASLRQILHSTRGHLPIAFVERALELLDNLAE